ncbi:hypothetical protein GM658_10785 [Pseudoduganella eburnea]|uniref:Uncharacterized protein n=1 Tax=Massilia eburnea TaxID=1776165 RepID=A0A6L6QF16_9BURK|nr:hypothetical protein [Massilia eburnea]MTW11088.1 hypothetical protein [Massilia eburnea]
MMVTDLPFPIVIVAPDGWAELIENGNDANSWNSIAIRKYSGIGFIVADASGSVWDLVSLTPIRKPTLFDRFRLQPRPIVTDVLLKGTIGHPLAIFCERLRDALSADSDCMTHIWTPPRLQTFRS